MRIMRTKTLARVVVIFGCSILAIGQDRVPQVRDAHYRLVKTIPLGGTGLWDRMALDTAERRLYVPRDTHVAVLNVDTGATVGDVAGMQGAHGVALAPALGRGFVSNGLRNTVTVIVRPLCADCVGPAVMVGGVRSESDVLMATPVSAAAALTAPWPRPVL